MRISVWQVFGLLGTLAAELSSAAVDGKITLGEGISILDKICKSLGIDFDTAGLEIPPPTEEV